jgi:hypothetical protein
MLGVVVTSVVSADPYDATREVGEDILVNTLTVYHKFVVKR